MVFPLNSSMAFGSFPFLFRLSLSPYLSLALDHILFAIASATQPSFWWVFMPNIEAAHTTWILLPTKRLWRSTSTKDGNIIQTKSTNKSAITSRDTRREWSVYCTLHIAHQGKLNYAKGKITAQRKYDWNTNTTIASDKVHIVYVLSLCLP